MSELFIARVWIYIYIHRSGALTALTWLVPLKLLPSRHVLCTPYNHALCHLMQNHIRKVHACLAVTCQLHFGQNDRDLLRVTAVTRGWNGHRTKSQHIIIIFNKLHFLLHAEQNVYLQCTAVVIDKLENKNQYCCKIDAENNQEKSPKQQLISPTNGSGLWPPSSLHFR